MDVQVKPKKHDLGQTCTVKQMYHVPGFRGSVICK